MRVLLTCMSGTGKSALVRELRRRGCRAHDADHDNGRDDDELADRVLRSCAARAA